MSAPNRRLRTRIVWTTAVVAALAMAAMIVAVTLVLNAITSNEVDAKLHDRMSLISAAIANDTDPLTAALSTSDDAVDASTWLYAADGRLLVGPNAGSAVQAVADGLAKVRAEKQVTHGERVYLAAPVDLAGKTPPRGVLVVSESLEPYEATRSELLLVLIALGLTVTVGTTAVAAWTMSRTLAPVVSMAAQAEEWSEYDLDARFDGPDVEHEIGHLGRTLNLLLDRVAGALRNEQRLTAELAHELRTPLTSARGEAELALARTTDPALRESLERVIASADQMSGTITTLLAIARGEGGASRASTVDAVVRTALAAQEAAGVPVEVDVPADLILTVNGESAARALAPLLANAIRYATSQVRVTAQVVDHQVRIEVDDDGPGLDGSIDPESVFEPGTREQASPGAGLGLALSRRVARSLGGDVVLGRRQGPTSFVLTLPIR